MAGKILKPLHGIDRHDFDRLAKTQGSARERRRYLAFAHISQGKSFSEAAAAVRVSRRALMKWVKRFREQGIDGLKESPGRGAKLSVSAEEQAAFKEAVLELQRNRNGGRIRGKDVLELMIKKYGIEPCLSTVYNTLKRVDLVWISGRSQHPNADIEAQENFKKNSQRT
ncbi:MAG: transposase [Parachlamydiales bacterium]